MANKPSQPAPAVSLRIVEIKLAADSKRNFSLQLLKPTFLCIDFLRFRPITVVIAVSFTQRTYCIAYSLYAKFVAL
jgi:hypothetical protein